VILPTYSDTEYTIDAGDGFVFGPYGPGRCEAVHPGSGLRCYYGARHVGCHTAVAEDCPSGEVTYRW
jgi:hypothetical protein